MLTVTAHTVDNTVILSCQGRLVRGEESELLCAAVHHHGRDVVLDLTGVSAIDAAGVGALVSLQAAGIYLKLLNPTAPVRGLLRLTRMETVFEICEVGCVEELTQQGAGVDLGGGIFESGDQTSDAVPATRH